jgi:hypothetical protein
MTTKLTKAEAIKKIKQIKVFLQILDEVFPTKPIINNVYYKGKIYC